MSHAISASAAVALRVLWIETGQQTSESGLAWLRQRMQQFRDASRAVAVIEHAWPIGSHQPSIGDSQRVAEIINSGVERIVVACVNRLDYPMELIQFLQQTFPEVPLAVASDTWWDGRRRTGLATPGHLSLAWYRWWDGWVDWLQGRSPTLFEVAPAPWPLLSSQPPSTALGTRGLIVGNCRQTTHAWALAADAAGHAAECVSWQQFQQWFPMRWSQALPLWALWDDTCLDTIPQPAERQLEKSVVDTRRKNVAPDDGQAVEQGRSAPAGEAAMQVFLELLAAAAPQASPPAAQTQPAHRDAAAMLGILAVGMPRADWALRLCASPARELLVKPTAGQGLMRLLNQHAQPRHR